jgi:predicted AAA+ superfamily ATPase
MPIQEETNAASGLVKREAYLSEIRKYLAAPFIKILSGIRRSGKSSILELLRDELGQNGKAQDNVIYINLETWEPESLSAGNLSKVLKTRLGSLRGNRAATKKPTILLDEVQYVAGWERTVNALFAAKAADIFITGSNSKLLSSELATLLSGRYVRFTIRPLSYSEFLNFSRTLGKRRIDSREGIWDYLRWGGFPGIHYFNEISDSLVYKTVADIYSAIVLKDVIERNKLRNADFLDRLVKFLFDNVGSMVSARSISAYFKNQKRSIGVDTVLDYIGALQNAFIFEKCPRWDIRGKKLLNVREKYYVADISFINAVLGYDDRRVQGLIENVIYAELRRRHYDVFVGQLEDAEIDFIASRGVEKLYIQAVYLINNDKKIIDREFGNLLKIKDQYPKYVVGLDPRWSTQIEGVKYYYLPDFLLADNWI